MLERLQWALDPRRSIVDSRDPQGQIVWVCLKLLELELLPGDRSEQQEDRAGWRVATRRPSIDYRRSTRFHWFRENGAEESCRWRSLKPNNYGCSSDYGARARSR
jgi:hypothetical protein